MTSLRSRVPSATPTTDAPARARVPRWRRVLPVVVLLLALAAAPEPRAQTTTPSGDTPNAVAPEGADGLPRRVALRFLTDNDYPPFNYLDADGVLTGFNIDLARALCLELSAACDIKTRPWNEMLLAVKKGEADAVIASHAVTPRLVAELGVTDRYYHTPGRFAGKRGVAYGATPEGLDGKRIGVAKGTAHEAYVRQFFTLSPVQTFETVELARDALVTGAVDVLFDDGISLVFWLNGTASKACCEFKGGAYFEPKYFGDGVGIIVGKDDLQLKALFNAALKKVRDNGRYEELVLKYFPLRAY